MASSRRLTLAATRPNGRGMPEQSEAIAQLSFEAALKRLEEIVRTLEGGEAPLDESIRLYEEGEALKRQCEARLQAAQARIEKIQIGRDGEPSGTVSFDGE
jgi:exodeoxyribonuclease VII small subunit